MSGTERPLQFPRGREHEDSRARIAPTAVVGTSCHVGECTRVTEYARVEGCAIISGGARVGDAARITGFARVAEVAVVTGHARVADHAQVLGQACIDEDASIAGGARVGGSARVAGQARVAGTAIVTGVTHIASDGLVERTEDYLTIGPLGARVLSATLYRTQRGTIDLAVDGAALAWVGSYRAFTSYLKQASGALPSLEALGALAGAYYALRRLGQRFGWLHVATEDAMPREATVVTPVVSLTPLMVPVIATATTPLVPEVALDAPAGADGTPDVSAGDCHTTFGVSSYASSEVEATTFGPASWDHPQGPAGLSEAPVESNA